MGVAVHAARWEFSPQRVDALNFFVSHVSIHFYRRSIPAVCRHVRAAAVGATDAGAVAANSLADDAFSLFLCVPSRAGIDLIPDGIRNELIEAFSLG
jgi:hypothetical protein